MQGLVLGDLSIAVDDADAATLTLVWAGASNSRDPGSALGPFFQTALAEASTRRKSLALRLEALTHFNSSTIAAIIKLVENARARSVPVLLSYDASQRWQHHSLATLAHIHAGPGFTLQPLNQASVTNGHTAG